MDYSPRIRHRAALRPSARQLVVWFLVTLAWVSVRAEAPQRAVLAFDDVAILAEGLLEPGAETSWWLSRDGALVSAREPDRRRAVGSAFKLFVLEALERRVRQNVLRWNDVMSLEPHHRSLPSGRLQRWPIGSPLTLHSLAAAMISESDNTATDMLLERVGRFDSVLAKPVLTTRQFFVLRADPPLARRYGAADRRERERLLKTLASRPLPSIAEIATPWQPGVEWYASSRALCAVMQRLDSTGVLAINPGPVDPTDWSQVAYKGGSEVGVLNTTLKLVDRDNHEWCLSVTWNARNALDERSLLERVATLARAMARTVD